MRVMIIDDDAALLRTLRLLLGAQGHDVRVFASRAGAMEAMESFQPHVALADMAMPEGEGADDLAELRGAMPTHSRMFVITGHSDRASALPLDDVGAEALLLKPLDLDRLLAALETCPERAATP